MVKRSRVWTIVMALVVIGGLFILHKVNASETYNTAQGGEGLPQRCNPDKIIKFAKGEVGKKYPDRTTPYGNNGEAWCAYFAEWVYQKAGCKITDEGNSRKLLEWFGYVHPPVMTNPYDAMGGDIIVWKYKSEWRGHAGVVINNDSTSKVIWVVEGNSTEGNEVLTRKFSYKLIANRDSMNFKLYGFGRIR